MRIFYSVREYMGAFGFEDVPKALFGDGYTARFVLNDLNKETVSIYKGNNITPDANTSFFNADMFIAEHDGIVGAIPNGYYDEDDIKAIFLDNVEEKVNMNENKEQYVKKEDDKYTLIQSIFTGLGVIGGFKLARGLVKAVVNGNGLITTAAMGVIEIAISLKGGQYGRIVGKCIDTTIDCVKKASDKYNKEEE